MYGGALAAGGAERPLGAAVSVRQGMVRVIAGDTGVGPAAGEGRTHVTPAGARVQQSSGSRVPSPAGVQPPGGATGGPKNLWAPRRL